MSEVVNAVGLMGPLVLLKNMMKDQIQEVNEKLYDIECNLRINYESTLVYSFNEIEEYYLNFYSTINKKKAAKIFQDLKKYNLFVDLSMIMPYSVSYYNGCDSPLDTLKLKDFLNEFKGKDREG